MLLLNALNARQAAMFRMGGLALIVWSVFTSRYAPATAGRGLFVLALVVVAVACWLAWTAWTSRLMRLTPDIYALAVCGGLLASATPGSAGSAFAFVAAMVASVRAGVAYGLAVAALGAVTLAAGAIAYGNSALGVVAYAVGFGAMALAGSNLRQTEQRVEQAELLLAQTQRSHEEQLRAARLEEQARIARDIHDVLAHALAGLTIQLEATDALLAQGADVESVRGRVQRAHELARQGLSETRRAVGALRGDAPDPVAARIERLVSDHAAITDVPVAVHLDGSLEDVGTEVGEAVVRTVQEALTNVRKHAPGARVSVAVSTTGDHVTVSVVDQVAEAAVEAGADVGSATAVAAEPGPSVASELSRSGGGFGLVGMRERAERLGGELRAGPTDAGFEVALRVPTGGGT